MNECPLVSICITCFNQAEYIGDAVRSALEQLYDPLEIVISDDNSTDGTFEIIKDILAKYEKNGKHTVLLNRNLHNLGVARNYEKCFRMSHGSLIVTGAGDDISLPNRVSRIVSIWEEHDRKPTVLMHAWTIVDGKGNRKGTAGPYNVMGPLGAATAYVRDVVDAFEDVPDEDGLYEDSIFTARGLMLGPCVYIKDALIEYRVGMGLTSNCAFRRHRTRVINSVLKSCKVTDRDIAIARKKNLCKNDFIRQAEAIVNERRRHYEPENACLNGRTFRERLCGYKGLLPDNGWRLDWRRRWFYYLPCLLPWRTGDAITMIWLFFSKVKRLLRNG